MQLWRDMWPELLVLGFLISMAIAMYLAFVLS